MMYWIERCSLVCCRDVHYRHASFWHAAALIGFLLGSVMAKLRPVPKTKDEGAGLVLIARRSG